MSHWPASLKFFWFCFVPMFIIGFICGLVAIAINGHAGSNAVNALAYTAAVFGLVGLIGMAIAAMETWG